MHDDRCDRVKMSPHYHAPMRREDQRFCPSIRGLERQVKILLQFGCTFDALALRSICTSAQMNQILH